MGQRREILDRADRSKSTKKARQDLKEKQGKGSLTEGWQGRVLDMEEGSTEESSIDEEARLGEGADRKKARQTRMLGRENCAAEKNPRQRRELA